MLNTYADSNFNPQLLTISHPTPHIGLMYKNDDGKLTLVHYTHGKVVIQNFKNEEDFINRMPYEVYRYDTAEYKSLED